MLKAIRLFNCETERATIEQVLSDKGGDGEERRGVPRDESLLCPALPRKCL